jgi:hypothetical protein
VEAQALQHHQLIVWLHPRRSSLRRTAAEHPAQAVSAYSRAARLSAQGGRWGQRRAE